MNLKQKIEKLIGAFLDSRKDLYLIGMKISPENNITIILDGDRDLSLQDCLDASRAIESHLDRDQEDFSLQITSPGLDEPLSQPRQYKKNIGRELNIITNNGSTIKGELKNADDQKLTLILRYRKPKENGNGKIDVVEEKELNYNDIKKALTVTKF